VRKKIQNTFSELVVSAKNRTTCEFEANIIGFKVSELEHVKIAR